MKYYEIKFSLIKRLVQKKREAGFYTTDISNNSEMLEAHGIDPYNPGNYHSVVGALLSKNKYELGIVTMRKDKVKGAFWETRSEVEKTGNSSSSSGERTVSSFGKSADAEKLGPQSKSDNAMTAKYRLLQSRYRAEVLKEECGLGPHKNSKKYYGNMLVNGEMTGSNFISPAAFEFAKEKVLQKKQNKALTIDEFRLFNNMLSSMPMCFNLFSDLRQLLKDDPGEASRIAKVLFQEIPWVDRLIEVDVEFIPTPIQDYTNDKSAFDAMLIIQDQDGQKGLISIETKYTDILGGNAAKDSVTKNTLVERGSFFDEELKAELRESGYKQIHRNFLLSYAYALKQGFAHFVNVVISPEEDRLSVAEIEELRGHMTQYQDQILKIPLETVVGRGIQCKHSGYSQVITKFCERYLET